MLTAAHTHFHTDRTSAGPPCPYPSCHCRSCLFWPWWRCWLRRSPSCWSRGSLHRSYFVAVPGSHFDLIEGGFAILRRQSHLRQLVVARCSGHTVTFLQTAFSLLLRILVVWKWAPTASPGQSHIEFHLGCSDDASSILTFCSPLKEPPGYWGQLFLCLHRHQGRVLFDLRIGFRPQPIPRLLQLYDLKSCPVQWHPWRSGCTMELCSSERHPSDDQWLRCEELSVLE